MGNPFNGRTMNGRGYRKWFWYFATEAYGRVFGSFKIKDAAIRDFAITQFDIKHFALARFLAGEIKKQASSQL